MTKTRLKISGLVLLLLSSGTITLVTMFLTTPKQLGPSGVTFWFISLLASVVSVLSLLFVAFKWRFLQGKNNPNKTINSSFRTAFLTGIGLVTFLALRSLGTLGLKDIILLSLVLILIEFYLRTRKPVHG